MRVLLDTHALLWSLFDEIKLPPATRSLVRSLETEVFVSAASAWEVATKYRLGRLPGAESLAGDFSNYIAKLGFCGLEVTIEHAQRAGLLPGSHKDPFDRMLIAQAQAENLPLISNEQIFDEYHIRRIW